MKKRIYHLQDGWGGNPNYDGEGDDCEPGAFGRDNKEVLTDNKDYNEYCLGDSVIRVTELEMWHTDAFNNNKGGFYIELRTW